MQDLSHEDKALLPVILWFHITDKSYETGRARLSLFL